MGGFDLYGLLGSVRASMLPQGTLSLGLRVIAVDPAFIAGHQSIKKCRIWIDQLDYLLTFMIKYFFLIFLEHPWDRLWANIPHLQFLANNCVYNCPTDIKLGTFCLYRHTTVLIHKSLYLANQFWCSAFLTPPTPLIIPHKLPAFLEFLCHSKTYARFMQDATRAVWSIPYISVAFFPSLKLNFIAYRSSMQDATRAVWSIPYISVAFFPSLKLNFIAYRSSMQDATRAVWSIPYISVAFFPSLKLNFIAYRSSKRSDCIFEIHQLWQSGFSSMYSNCWCRCSFEPEIIKLGQSPH